MTSGPTTSRPIREPGPEHPITIEPNPARVVVSVGARTIADTRDALTLREAGYAPVQYIPLQDVDTSQLAPSEHVSYCPYKGDASYYSVPAGAERSANAAWTYLDPFPAVEAIRGRIAFYPHRVDAIDVDGSAAPG